MLKAEGNEEIMDWAGPWKLDVDSMTWHRPYYHHDFNTGEKTDIVLRHTGPMVRPVPLQNVVQLNVPLAVLRSHPDTPGALNKENEGIWMSTNPAWPDQSIDFKLRTLRAHTNWEDFSVDAAKETFEFGGLGNRILEAHIIYVQPGEQHKAA